MTEENFKSELGKTDVQFFKTNISETQLPREVTQCVHACVVTAFYELLTQEIQSVTLRP